MLTLGINAFHPDAAAVLYRDGRLVAAVAEERLNRVKHCAGFPTMAVREVLRIGNASLADVHSVAFAGDDHANVGARLAYAAKHPRRTGKLALGRLRHRAARKGVKALLAESCGVDPADVTAQVHRVEHHLAHAASSFLASPFERAAILTLDGFGDFTSTMASIGEGSDIKALGRVHYPHSLGVLYSAVCQFIGFDRYGDEGKVMGLAPYGEPVYSEFFERAVRFTDRGFALDLKYFNHHVSGVDTAWDAVGSPSVAPLYSQALAGVLGKPRARGAEVCQRDMDVAASLQRRLEEAFIHLANLLHRRTGLTDLCLAGGVALNGVANGRLLKETPFERIFIQPAAGDDGTALGAAAWTAARAGCDRFEMRHAAWGSRFSGAEIRQALGNGDGFDVVELPEDELLDRTAGVIAAGKVVGWFQGAMEWGPRALGQRSIVAHPGHPRMKTTLNARIKHREPFRPFAPSIKEERLGEYYDSTHPSPFMLMVYESRAAKRDELIAVDHVDHTGRVQTVSREANPRYWGLIDAFERRTGTPVLLNTSFNENEPIVCTPDEAIDCFRRTNMDAVVMGNFLCTRGRPAEVAAKGLPAGAVGNVGADEHYG